jgi:serine/threonine protein kinase
VGLNLSYANRGVVRPGPITTVDFECSLGWPYETSQSFSSASWSDPHYPSPMPRNGGGSLPMPPGYEFVGLLGQGSSGWVALAIQSSIGRQVAIKILHGGGGNPAEVRRLHREGQALATLRHPSIAKIYELIETGNNLSLVMEYVPGGNFQTALDQHALAGSAVVRLLCDTGEALTYAASQGIVHRDVKPGNVLLDRDQRAKVADFGLARISRNPGSFRTMSSSLRGTLSYIAPEQILDPGTESSSVDAYAFAVLCYRSITGTYPYAITSPSQLIDAHLHLEPISPHHYSPALPAAIITSLLAGLAKDPLRRASPEDLSSSLRSLSDATWDELISTLSIPGPDSPTRQSRAPSGADRSGHDKEDFDERTRGTPIPDTGGKHLGHAFTTIPLVEPSFYVPPKNQKRFPRVSKRLRLVIGAVVGIGVGLLIALH